MRRSKTLEKLRENQLVRICGLGHYIPLFVGQAAHCGYDSIWLDLEHRAMDDREVQALLTFCHQFDIDCMLRPPTLEKSRLYRYLEDGAAGLMIPHVSTVEKAEQLVQATKFPPLGDRGMDAAGMDTEFSLPDQLTYAEEANRETFLVVQIETVQAIENVEKIAAVEGVDGLFLGPADLAFRLTHAAGNSMTVDQARERLAAACAKHGKAWGQPAATLEAMQQFYDMGARLLAHGGDSMGFIKFLKECSLNCDAVDGG